MAEKHLLLMALVKRLSTIFQQIQATEDFPPVSFAEFVVPMAESLKFLAVRSDVWWTHFLTVPFSPFGNVSSF